MTELELAQWLHHTHFVAGGFDINSAQEEWEDLNNASDNKVWLLTARQLIKSHFFDMTRCGGDEASVASEDESSEVSVIPASVGGKNSASVQPKRIKCTICGNDIHIGKWAGVMKDGFICNDTFCLIELAKRIKESEDSASVHSSSTSTSEPLNKSVGEAQMAPCESSMTQSHGRFTTAVPPKGVNIDFCEKGMTSNKFKSPPQKGVEQVTDLITKESYTKEDKEYPQVCHNLNCSCWLYEERGVR